MHSTGNLVSIGLYIKEHTRKTSTGAETKYNCEQSTGIAIVCRQYGLEVYLLMLPVCCQVSCRLTVSLSLFLICLRELALEITSSFLGAKQKGSNVFHTSLKLVH